MKNVSVFFMCFACVCAVGAADLSDLIIPAPASETVNPDDVMLRRPAARSRADLDARAKAAAAAAEARAKAAAEAEAKAKAEAEAKAKAEAEAKAKEEAAKARAAAEAEAKARAEAEAKAKEEAAKARAAAEAEAKEEAAKARAAAEAEAKAKAEAEAKAKLESEIQTLREQVAREKAARENVEGKAAVDRAAAEKAAAQAVADRAAAEKAAAQAAADRAAAQKAAEAKAAAEKRISYLQNPDPDERPKPKKLEAPAEQRDVTETVPAPGKKAKKAKGATTRTGRDAVITSERTDYDRKEGIILFDRNVFVDDEQYQMHADRLFVFLDGTNDLKRIVAIGNVSITNEARTASCSRAVFTKAASKIVMYGDENSYARLEDPSQRGGMAEGKKITFWLDAEQVSVEESAVRLPGAALKARDPKKMLEQAK